MTRCLYTCLLTEVWYSNIVLNIFILNITWFVPFQQEDVEIAIVYPLVSVLLCLLLWKFIISKIAYCIVGMSDKIVNGLVIGVAHLISLQRTSPYEGEFEPSPQSTEWVLLFSASYHLKTAFCSASKTDISYNLMVFITIMDVISYQKGGDTMLYFLLLLEAPDIIGGLIVPFLRNEACFEVIYMVLYISFKICLLGQIIYLEIMNSKISEDIKMNIFIVYLYSLTCLPALFLGCYQFCTGNLDASLTGMLPQLTRKRLEVVRFKGCKRRSYSRRR